MPSVAGEGIRNVSPAEFRPLGGAYYSVGIHPWQASEASPADWERLKEAVRHPSVLAVGEAGLDKRTSVPLELQKEVFVRQVLLSETVCKPLVIHCVKAFNELVEMKRKYRPSVPWVVHGFRNNLHIARTLMQEGHLFLAGRKIPPRGVAKPALGSPAGRNGRKPPGHPYPYRADGGNAGHESRSPVPPGG